MENASSLATRDSSSMLALEPASPSAAASEAAPSAMSPARCDLESPASCDLARSRALWRRGTGVSRGASGWVTTRDERRPTEKGGSGSGHGTGRTARARRAAARAPKGSPRGPAHCSASAGAPPPALVALPVDASWAPSSQGTPRLAPEFG
eukprot:scaffold2303_cov69-Phaeocystis_antarctica.AAC.1